MSGRLHGGFAAPPPPYRFYLTPFQVKTKRWEEEESYSERGRIPSVTEQRRRTGQRQPRSPPPPPPPPLLLPINSFLLIISSSPPKRSICGADALYRMMDGDRAAARSEEVSQDPGPGGSNEQVHIERRQRLTEERSGQVHVYITIITIIIIIIIIINLIII
ncbi:unnamed protein product [Pleuronectes platessa]|uniref:Uncharacterized protein n=1 Tax=Pleuronectes platessa TaxID=8262 RepID=A0A9N7YN17_PLEPL|nr:unnamed protein product [Pleuronectes platessa]